MTTLTLTVNDTAPRLAGKVNAVLTGATASLHILRPDGSTLTRAATIDDAATGAWSAGLLGFDLNVSGNYFTELQVTFSSGAVETFALDAKGNKTGFYVRDEIA